MARDESRKIGRDQVMKEATSWEETFLNNLFLKFTWPLNGYAAIRKLPQSSSLLHTSRYQTASVLDPDSTASLTVRQFLYISDLLLPHL